VADWSSCRTTVYCFLFDRGVTLEWRIFRKNVGFFKRADHEILVAEFFTHSKPVWVDDLNVQKRITTYIGLGLRITILFFSV
jgi:hypothetical protein